MATTLRYLASRETDVVLKDGSTLHVRPMRPRDEPGLLAFYTALSEDARLMRDGDFAPGEWNLQIEATTCTGEVLHTQFTVRL